MEKILQDKGFSSIYRSRATNELAHCTDVGQYNPTDRGL